MTSEPKFPPPLMRRVLLIVNPFASGVTPRARVLVQNSIATRHHLEVAETHRRGHATRIAQGAIARGIDLVVCLGGDGTINEVVNGLVGSDVALGVLPGGSTNVFARTLGLANEPTESVETLLDAFDQESIRRVGLGRVNSRYFCFHVGMGFDAHVVAKVEQRGALKRFFGHPLFAYSGFVTFFRDTDRTRPPFVVDLPGPLEEPHESELPRWRDRIRADGVFVTAEQAAQRARERLSARRRRSSGSGLATSDPAAQSVEGFFAIALNSDPYTYFGSRPMSLVPGTTLDTPLSFVVLRTLGFRETMTTVGASLLGGNRVERRPHLSIERNVVRAVVRGHRPFPYQVDGDYLGHTELLDFGWEPEVLRLVVP